MHSRNKNNKFIIQEEEDSQNKEKKVPMPKSIRELSNREEVKRPLVEMCIYKGFDQGFILNLLDQDMKFDEYQARSNTFLFHYQ